MKLPPKLRHNRHIGPLQQHVDDCIRQLGGYWRPLSAVARLVAGLGDLANAVGEIAQGEPQLSKCGNELADVFVISTCLANQYCIDLHKEYEKIGLNPFLDGLIKQPAPSLPVHEQLYRISWFAGDIGRIVNCYEGDTAMRPESLARSIGKPIANLHSSLFGLAATLRLNPLEHIIRVLEDSLGQDYGQLEARYDPSAALSKSHFDNIRNRVQCPYALEARLWGSPEWNPCDTMEDNLAHIIPSFHRFTRIADSEGLDGYILEVSGTECGNSVANLSRLLFKILSYLSDVDPAEDRAMQMTVEDPNWQFSFNGMRLFIAAFAPCYDDTSSRFAYGQESVFILFQPESSFDRHGIDRSVKERIRSRFRRRGQPLDLVIMEQPLEAPRYVKPLHVGDLIVRWWDDEEASNN
jgi:YqcI/YcgG family protein